jgi:carboxylesterase
LPPIDDAKDLDGKLINDSSIAFPEAYLLSAAKPNPSAADLLKPVVIAVHGFSASTFEWTEFKEWAATKNDILTSLVLLGGHGRDYADFKKATWSDWQQPIIDEYNKLVNLGYQHIHFAASSTGCPLVLNMIRRKLADTRPLRKVMLVDPIIIPGNKQLALIPGLKGMITYTETTIEKGEGGYWYKYRPAEALQELEKIARQERIALEKGYTLPEGIRLKVYKSLQDNAVDPLSAVQLFKGLMHHDGTAIDVSMENSSLHVFTRLRGRDAYTAAYAQLQLKTFNDIYERVK